MLNPNWQRWILSSCAKYFGDQADGTKFYVEGDTINFVDDQQWVEFRTDGLSTQELTNNYFRIDLCINLLLNDVIVKTDLYTLQRLVGKFQSMFGSSIPIYKYGSGVDDDGTLLCCLEIHKPPKDKVQSHYFGKVGPSSQLQQATIEAHYFTHLTGV